MFTVLGATGKVGRTTVTALRREGVPVRAVVRDPSRAEHLAALGCEIAVADARDAAALVRAFEGASAVQVICPVSPQAANAAGEMRRSIEAVGQALEAVRAPVVLAISDYGAELPAGTGVTVLFHVFEERLRGLSSRLIFLRSAEHMENWSRVIKTAAQTGTLPSLHHPLTKRFPTISAFDVGALAAELLLSPLDDQISPRIIYAEGPRRCTAEDVAEAVSLLAGCEVRASELPRKEWEATLRRAGLSESYCALVTELYDAHNAGQIDAKPEAAEIRYGQTPLLDALRAIPD